MKNKPQVTSAEATKGGHSPHMPKGPSETQVGLLVILAVIAAFVLMEVAGSVNFFTETVRIKARFHNIKDLKKGDPVKVAGVKVGRVNSMGFDLDKVLVEMDIESQQKAAIRTDSEASIQFEGLMGQHFIAVKFGTSGLPVEQGTELKTIEQPDLSTLMVKLEGVAEGIEQVTSTFSGDTVRDILSPLGDLIQDNKEKLSRILTNFETVSGQISSGEGSLGKLISDPQLYQAAASAAVNLEQTSGQVHLLIQEARNTMSNLNEGKGTLGKLSNDPALYDETIVAVTNLREILEKLNQGQGSIGMLINDPSLLNNATATLQKVNKATESLEDQGPMSVIGMALGNLF
ncbi:MAG: MlaD family protein [Verrucomicrobiota bacterium]|nr:MlaD family protein [Verrucomicrobiota bacterium]